jgi:ribosomal protein L19
MHQLSNKNHLINNEGKTTYRTMIFRKEMTRQPKSIYIFEEDRQMSQRYYGIVVGGLNRAINVTLMRYEEKLALESTLILLAERINGQQIFRRIFIQRKKGWLFQMVKWSAYRTTFGRAGDLPLEIVGITRACDDEILMIENLLNKTSSQPPEAPQIID